MSKFCKGDKVKNVVTNEIGYVIEVYPPRRGRQLYKVKYDDRESDELSVNLLSNEDTGDRLNVSEVTVKDMKELDKAYEAVEMLESLGVPVSKETLNAISLKEKEHLYNKIVPLIKQELKPLVGKMRTSFLLSVSYSKEAGIDISVADPQKQIKNELLIEDRNGYRWKKSRIRVTFPDKHVSFHKKSSETFAEVIKYAGGKKVERMGFEVLGKNLVSTSLFENEKYKKYQREIEPGLYVCTYCNTKRKLKILNKINRELKLNLVIEEVMIEDERE